MVLGRAEEKRKFRRMAVDCPVTFQLAGQPGRHQARGEELSAGGLAFVTEVEMVEGAELEVEVAPGNGLTPAMRARVTVVRVDELAAGRRISGRIEEILG